MAPVIYGYMPVRGEVDITGILKESFRQHKTVAVPRCIDRQGHMAFFVVRSFDELVPGHYGIPEPSPEAEPIEVEKGLMLVPGVGFDHGCNRLGYGGGYYDRFIGAALGVYYVAPAYEIQLVKNLPVDEYDARVDRIITEKQTIKGD